MPGSYAPRIVLSLTKRGAIGSFAAILALGAVLLAPVCRADGDSPFASGQLQVQGSRLTVDTRDVDQVVNLGEAARIRTCYAGAPCGTASSSVSGLDVVADLSGPELPDAVRLTTAPGGTFFLPAFQREGDYTLANIRLVAHGTDRVVASATPTVAIVHVLQILLTSTEVTPLTLAELSARGISITQENFQAFRFVLGFLFAGSTVSIELPVLYQGNGLVTPLDKPAVNLDGLPSSVAHLVSRWEPPTIVPFRLEAAPADRLQILPDAEEEARQVPLFGAIVLPGSVSFLNQFFDARLIVMNGAPAGTPATLENVTGTLRLPTGDVLRLAATDPPITFGQALPVLKDHGGRSLDAGEQGSAAWTVEGLISGTRTMTIDVAADLTRPGRATVPLAGVAQATVEIVDPRFHLSFSHPDAVREGEAYTLYVTVTNLSRAAQQQVGIAFERLQGAQLAPGFTAPPRIPTLAPGASETLEFRLVAQVTGRCVASTFETKSDGLTGDIRLVAGVGELGIPLSPATLVLPRFADRLAEPLLAANLRLLGLAYSLATAPAGLVPSGLPRVIQSDVVTRAVDLGQAGQRTFLKEPMLESLEVLALDQLGNRAPLAEFDALRRSLDKGTRAAVALGDALRAEQQARNLSAAGLVDHLASTTSYARPYIAAAVLPSGGALPDVEIVSSSAAGAGFLAFAAGRADRLRTVAFGEVYSLSDAPGGAADVPLSVVGSLDADTSYRLRLHVPANATAASGRLVAIVPSDARDGFLRLDFGQVSLAPGNVFEVRLAKASTESASTNYALVYAGTVTPVAGGAPSISAVAVPPFRLIGAVQDFVLDRYGLGVSYLFNRPPSVASAQHAASYTVRTRFHGQDTNSPAQVLDREMVTSGAAAFVEPSERVVDVRYAIAVSPLEGLFGGAPILAREHLVDAAALSDVRGNHLETPVPAIAIEPNHVGGLVDGKVVRGNGDAVSGATVQLIRHRSVCPGEAAIAGASSGFECMTVNDLVGEETTGSDGAFYFDFIEEPPADASIHGGYTLRALVPAGADPSAQPEEKEEVSSVIRLQNRVQHVNIALLGRGTITGRLVYRDGGTPVAGGTVTAASTLFGESKSSTVAADGSFRFGGMPVGPITLSGSDALGHHVYATVGLTLPGETRDVLLQLDRSAQPRTGTVAGTVVVRRDAASGAVLDPVPGATVGVYAAGILVEQKSADGAGAFRFERVPEGLITLQAADFKVSRTAAYANALLHADETLTETLTLAAAAPRTVVGRVLFHDSASNTDVPVAGAAVFIPGPGVFTYSGIDGTYRLDGVPTQGLGDAGYSLTAIDFTRKLQGQTTLLPVLDVGDGAPIQAATITLANMAGGVDGLVLDPLGRPVANASVVLYPLAESVTRGDGRFSFENVPVGPYRVVAHVDDGLTSGKVGWFGDAATEVVFGGHRPTVIVRMRGAGVVKVKTRTASAGVLSPVYYAPTVYSDHSKSIGPATSALQTSTDPAGDLTLTLPIGDFTVTASNPFNGTKSARGTLDYPGQVKEVDLLFDSTSTVNVRVVDVDGVTPVPGADLTFSSTGFLPRTVKSDGQGGFAFELVPTGPVGVKVRAQLGTVERVGQALGLVTAGGQTLELVVSLQALGTVQGRVVEDTGSGRVPFAHAQLYLREGAYPYRRLPETGFFTANAAGEYEVAGVNAGNVSVVARDPNQVTRMGRAEGQITADWQVVRLADAVISGAVGSLAAIIRDPGTGAGVPDCRVKLSTGEETVSDAEGVASFDALPLGTYAIWAFHAPTGRTGIGGGFVLDTAGVRVEKDVLLAQRGILKGTVFDDLAKTVPVGGATVRLSGPITALATADLALGNVGRFVFDGLPLGSYALTAAVVDSPRIGAASATLTTTASLQDIGIALEPSSDGYVRIFESLRAAPLHEVDTASGVFNVELRQPWPCNDRPFHGCTSSFVALQPFAPSPGHLYKFPGVLTARPLGFVVDELTGEHRNATAAVDGAHGAGTAADPYRMVLSPKGVVRVQVRDELGAAVAGANVTVTSTGGASFLSGTDSSGTATIYGVPAGAVTAAASVPGRGIGGRNVGVLTFDDDVLDLSVALAPSVSAHGAVYQPVAGDAWDGNPASLAVLANAVVTIHDSTGVAQTVVTGPDGAYRFDVLATGSYTITASSQDAQQKTNAAGTLAGPDGNDNAIAPLVLDGSAPRVVSISPPSGQTLVSRLAPVVVVFSEPLAAAVLPSGAASPYFVLVSASGNPPAGAWSTVLVSGGQVVTFTPSAPYENSTTYALTLLGGANGIVDRTGRPLTAFGNIGSTFTTSDTDGPRVVATVPSLDRPVDPKAAIRFDFSESLTAQSSELDGDGIGDAAELSWGENDGAGGVTWKPLPVAMFVTRLGYSLSVQQPQGVQLPNDSGRRLVHVSRLRDASGNAMAPFDKEYRIYDGNAPHLEVAFPLTAPTGQLSSGATYTLVPALTSLDGATVANPGGDIDGVQYFLASAADPTKPSSTPIFVATSYPFTYMFPAPAYTGDGTDPKPFSVWATAVDTSSNRSNTVALAMQVVPNVAPVIGAVTAAATAPVAGVPYAGSSLHAIVSGVSDPDGLQVTLSAELRKENAANPSDPADVLDARPGLLLVKPQAGWQDLPAQGFDLHIPIAVPKDTRLLVRAKAIDSRGSAAILDGDVFAVAADTTAPRVDGLLAKKSGSATPATLFTIGERFTLEFHAHDTETGLDPTKITVSFDGVFQTVPATLVPGSLDLQRTAEITVPETIGQARTTVVVTASAEDYGANRGSASLTLQLAPSDDPTAPTADWRSPWDGAVWPAAYTSTRSQAQGASLLLRVYAGDRDRDAASGGTVPGSIVRVQLRGPADASGTLSTTWTDAALVPGVYPAGEGLYQTAWHLPNGIAAGTLLPFEARVVDTGANETVVPIRVRAVRYRRVLEGVDMSVLPTDGLAGAAGTDGDPVFVLDGATVSFYPLETGVRTLGGLVAYAGADAAGAARPSVVTAPEISSYDSLVLYEPLELQLASVLGIGSGARVDVSGRGLLGSDQLGHAMLLPGEPGPERHAGGSHGGLGGDGVNEATLAATRAGVVTDSVRDPRLPGGGGGSGLGANGIFGPLPGGAGGGVVRLLAPSADVRIEGEIRADAARQTKDGEFAWGGGAGGTVRLVARSVAGFGTVSANGGSAEYDQWSAGGGGGRIAVSCVEPAAGPLGLGFAAAGGGNVPTNASRYAGAGTIFVERLAAATGLAISGGELLVANAPGGGASASTPLTGITGSSDAALVAVDAVASTVTVDAPGAKGSAVGDRLVVELTPGDARLLPITAQQRIAGSSGSQDQRLRLTVVAAPNDLSDLANAVASNQTVAAHTRASFDSVEARGASRLLADDDLEIGSGPTLHLNDRSAVALDGEARVLVRGERPTVDLLANPPPGEVTLGTHIALSFTAADFLGLARVEETWSLAGTSVFAYMDQQTSVTQGSSPITLDVPLTATPGPATLTLDATDLAGRTTRVVRTWNVLANQHPTGSAALPTGAPASLNPGDSFTVLVHAQDAEGLARVDVNAVGPVTLASASQIVSGTSADVSFTFTLQSNAPAGPTVTVTAAITDLAGQSTATNSVGIVVNPDAPPTGSLTLAAGTQPSVYPGAAITLSVHAADAEALARVVLRASGAAAPASQTVVVSGTSTDVPFTVSIDKAAAGGSNVVLQADVVDRYGNTVSTNTATIGVLADTNPPVIQVTGLVAGGVYHAGQTVQAQVSITDEVGAKRTDVTYDGSTTTLTDAASYVLSRPVDPSLAAARDTQLVVTATDYAGNTATSFQTTIHLLPDLAPTLTLSNLPAAQLLPGATITATADAGDDVGLTAVGFHLTGALTFDDPRALGGVHAQPSFSKRIPFDASAGSTITLSVDATDTFGHKTTAAPVTFTVLADTHAPTIDSVVLAPAKPGDAYTAGDVVAITVNASDDVVVSRVRVSITGQAAQEFTASPAVLTWTAPAVYSDTQATLTVEAFDPVGNAAPPVTRTLTVQPQVNPNAPVVTITCPSTGAYLPSALTGVTITATATATAGVSKIEFYAPDGTLISTTTSSGSPTTASATSAAIALPSVALDTVLHYRARAYDFANNIGESFTDVHVVPTVDLTAASLASPAALVDKFVVLRTGSLNVDVPLTVAGLIVLNGATLTHSAASGSSAKNLGVIVNGPTYVHCTGAIDVGGKGYGTSVSYPGATLPPSGNGGSHIGYGGQNVAAAVTTTYGSVYRPSEAGAGGECCSGLGGGIVKITATSVVVDGAIRANGTVSSRGGAGGSVWIVTGTLGGSGKVEAYGGGPVGGASQSDYGAGGGGAIAVEYASATGSVLASLNASGGWSARGLHGGAGTVFVKGPGATYGDLAVDNKGIAGSPIELPSLGAGSAVGLSGGASLETNRATPIPDYFKGHWVEVKSATGAVKGTWRIGTIASKTVTLVPNGGESIDVVVGDTWQGLYRFDKVTLNAGAFRSVDPVRFTDEEIVGAVQVKGVEGQNLVVKSGAVLSALPFANVNAPEALTIALGGSLTVNGTIDGNARGYATSVTYPGAAPPPSGNGGSHIGYGGQNVAASASTTYGSVYRPSEAGGGGESASGVGGGIVRITASSVNVDGTIRANGFVTSRGGAGGSIWITTGSLGGAGKLEAYGGGPIGGATQSDYGAGGGGSIAVEYASATGSVLSSVNAAGGWSARGLHAGAGTIYLKGPSATYGDLTVDNKGTAGAPTELPSLGSGTAGGNGGDGAKLATAMSSIPAYFRGHWVEIANGGTLKGSWQVNAVNGGTLTLLANSEYGAPTVAQGDAWQGVYRFDSVDVQQGSGFTSVDPIRSGTATYGGVGGTLNVTAPISVAGSLQIAGAVSARQITAGSLTVSAGATLTHPVAVSASSPESLVLNVGTLVVSGAIDVGGKGYGTSVSYPGATLPPSGNGGSHIGYGGQNVAAAVTTTYGSVYRPSEAGAGGECCSGLGGGIVKITATSVVVDGAIRANGTVSSRGGAGGSVWIVTGTLGGSGKVEAYGGGPVGGASQSDYGAGGGGAIAVEYASATGSVLASLNASGGWSARGLHGGAGTVFVKGPGATYGDLAVDNKGIAGSPIELPSLGAGSAVGLSGGASLETNRATPIPDYFKGHWVEVKSATGAVKGTWRIGTIASKTVTLVPNGGESIDVVVGDTWQGLYRFDKVTLNAGAFRSVDPVRFTDEEIVGAVQVKGVEGQNLVVKSGAVLSALPFANVNAPEALTIALGGSLTVNGTIDANARGYATSVTYPGAAPPPSGNGGSHIGYGGQNVAASASTTYGSVYRPSEAGGGGESASGVGGGIVRITASSVNVDGTIRANGVVTSRGGAGGSIWITTGSLGGAGKLEAYGGGPIGGATQSDYGAGGGGSIAVEYASATGSVLSSVNAAGGWSARGLHAGAGTIYLKGPSATYGDLTVDNKGTVGAPTELPSLGSGTVVSVTPDTLTTDRTTTIPPYFVGHWVSVTDVTGATTRGTWRIAEITVAKTVRLEGAPDLTSILAGSDKWQGVYRLDHAATVVGSAVLKNLSTAGLDPVRVVAPGGSRAARDGNGPDGKATGAESARGSRQPRLDLTRVLVAIGSVPGSYRVTVPRDAFEDASGIAALSLFDGASELVEPFDVRSGATFLWPGDAGQTLRLRALGGDAETLIEAPLAPLPAGGWTSARMEREDREPVRLVASSRVRVATAARSVSVHDRASGLLVATVAASGGRIEALTLTAHHLVLARGGALETFELDGAGATHRVPSPEGERILALAGAGSTVLVLSRENDGHARVSALDLSSDPPRLTASLSTPLVASADRRLWLVAGADGHAYAAAASAGALEVLAFEPARLERASTSEAASTTSEMNAKTFTLLGGVRSVHGSARGLVVASDREVLVLAADSARGLRETARIAPTERVLDAGGPDNALAVAVPGAIVLYDVRHGTPVELCRVEGSSQTDLDDDGDLLTWSAGFVSPPSASGALGCGAADAVDRGFRDVMDGRGRALAGREMP